MEQVAAVSPGPVRNALTRLCCLFGLCQILDNSGEFLFQLPRLAENVRRHWFALDGSQTVMVFWCVLGAVGGCADASDGDAGPTPS